MKKKNKKAYKIAEKALINMLNEDCKKIAVLQKLPIGEHSFSDENEIENFLTRMARDKSPKSYNGNIKYVIFQKDVIDFFNMNRVVVK